MKEITLIRHAEAEPCQPGQKDISRVLSKRGEQMAYTMGERLLQQAIRPEMVLSSPAERAIKTCHTMCSILDFPVGQVQVESEIYFARDVNYFFQLFQKLEEGSNQLFMFGHNPYISSLASALVPNLTMFTMSVCGVFRASFPVDLWAEILPGEGKYLSYDKP